MLFVSYDGLTDPLGQSQILPYFISLSNLGHQITILSCEKRLKSFNTKRLQLKKICEENEINWQFVDYSKTPPILSTFSDLAKMKRLAMALHQSHHFDWVHCRTILTVNIGLALQKKGSRLIFDIRGFWADERVDGKLWNLSNPLYAFVYKVFKRKEKFAYQHADRIVTLTQSAQDQLVSQFGTKRKNMTIVPCMADLDHFSEKGVDYELQDHLVKRLDLENKLIIGYCGSLGTRYLIKEMLLCFKTIKDAKNLKPSIFLIVTHSDTSELKKLITYYNLDGSVVITSSTYQAIPTYISIMDIALYFIFSGNSGKAVSPTKQAEFLALGVPIITNGGIGDSEKVLRTHNCGEVVNLFSEEEFKKVATKIPNLLSLPKEEIRETAKRFFDLNKGVLRYDDLYSS